MSMNVVAVHAVGLVKDFDTKRAVDSISLTVPAGSFYGIVGPNGAGKTTTIRMMVGLLRPDVGQLTAALSCFAFGGTGSSPLPHPATQYFTMAWVAGRGRGPAQTEQKTP